MILSTLLTLSAHDNINSINNIIPAQSVKNQLISIMESVLNVQVSCFKRCFTPSGMVTLNLLTWLTSDKYAKEVQAIRAEESANERSILKK